MSVKREPFGGFVIIRNGTKEQYEAAKKSEAIVFAEITDSSKDA